MADFKFSAIGSVRSVFREKFGAPRQSLMMQEARGVVKLLDEPRLVHALDHLDEFSHIWLIFVFDKHLAMPWRSTIEPPRLSAPAGVGVFASRSPHRPNPIGMSVVVLDRIDRGAAGGAELHVSGIDLLDGTPILDIKPYVPFADRVEMANSGWLKDDICRYPVRIDDESLAVLRLYAAHRYERIVELVSEMLSLDPRPTSQKRQAPLDDAASEGLEFAFRVLDLDIHWRVENQSPFVFKVVGQASAT